MAVEEQTQHNDQYNPGVAGVVKLGQILTISNRKVTKLGFWLVKIGAPTGDVTFEIRLYSDKTVIASQVAVSAASVATVATYYEVEFTEPPTINAQVIICSSFNVAVITDAILVRWQLTDVKADEWSIRYRQAAWGEYATYDTAYIYTYEGKKPGAAPMAAKLVSAGVI